MAAPAEQTSAVRDMCEKIVASRTFASSIELGKLLRYIVDKTLEGDLEALKQDKIAADLYPKNKDPNVVSVYAGRLRGKLAEYYRGEGSKASLRIDVPRGAYVASFSTPTSFVADAFSTLRRPLVAGPAVVIVLAVASVALWVYLTQPPADTSMFGFEDASAGTMAWAQHRENPASRAVAGVSRSTAVAGTGHGRGALRVDLTFGVGAQMGEVARHFNTDPLVGDRDNRGRPVDLSNKTITAYVRFNGDFVVDPQRPPVARLFLKDDGKLKLYGCTENLEVTDMWIDLRLSTAVDMPSPCRDGQIERSDNFDASKIVAIGVHVAANSQALPLSYTGPFFVDAVDWTPRNER